MFQISEMIKLDTLLYIINSEYLKKSTKGKIKDENITLEYLKKSTKGKIKDENITFFSAFPKWLRFSIYFYL